jgi:hypothetical protein
MLDTLHTALLTAAMYTVVVKDWSDLLALARSTWTLSVRAWPWLPLSLAYAAQTLRAIPGVYLRDRASLACMLRRRFVLMVRNSA